MSRYCITTAAEVVGGESQPGRWFVLYADGIHGGLRLLHSKRLRGHQLGTLETAEEARVHAREHRRAFDIIKDPESRIAELLDARRTPEAFLLDSSGALRYHGRIASKLSSPDLRTAIEAFLAGKPIRPAVTKAFGCAIQRD